MRARVKLIVSMDVAHGPERTTEDLARFAAESIHGDALSLRDADCEVYIVQPDETEVGPFYRTGAYRDALTELSEGDLD